jgi:hypothetical protein
MTSSSVLPTGVGLIDAAPSPGATIPSHRRSASFWRRRGPAFVGPVLYVAWSFAITANTWSHPTRVVIGTGGDPLSFVGALSWPTFAIRHGYNPFFSTYLVAPHGTNLMWTGSSGPGLILAPFVYLFGPVLTYNLMATLSLAVSAWFAQMAIYRLVAWRPAAIVGGFIFGFSPYMMGHAWGHVGITMAFLPPLILIVIHEIYIRQEWRWWATGIFAGMLLVIQYITFIETMVITGFAFAIVTILLIVQRPREVRARAPYAIRSLAVTAVTFLVVAAYPIWTMFFGGQQLGKGTVEPPDSFVTDIVNFIVPTMTTKIVPGFLHSASAKIGGGVEAGGYLGIPLIIICAFTAVRLWRKLVVRTAALTGIILAVFSMGPRLHVDGTIHNVPLPFAALLHVPLIDNVLAARLMGIADLCVGVLVAAFVVYLATARDVWRRVGIVLLGLGIILILPGPLPLQNEAFSVPSYFTGQGVKQIPPGSTALVAPYVTNGSEDQPQDWQAASGFRFRMPEGYVYVPSPAGPITGPLPTALGAEMVSIFSQLPGSANPQITAVERPQYIADLRAWHVQTVLVGPMPNYDQMVSFFTQLLGRSGTTQGGVVAWYNVER